MPHRAILGALALALATPVLAAGAAPGDGGAMPPDTGTPPGAEAVAATQADFDAAHPADGDIVETGADRYRRLTLEVHIGGEGPFDFMVDTGSQATVVSTELGASLQLPDAGTGTVVGMASRRKTPLAYLDGLAFAEREFNGLTIPLLDRAHLGADGIIGLDSLQGLRVLIDFRQQTISVADSEVETSDRGYEIVVRARRRLGQLIITDAVIDGVKTALIIDTGGQASIGNIALRDKLRAQRGAQATTMDVNGVTIGGTVSVARQIEIGQMRLSGVPLMFADSPAFAALGYGDRPALSLGMQDLRLFERVAIDFDKRRILFDLPRAKSRAEKPSRRSL